MKIFPNNSKIVAFILFVIAPLVLFSQTTREVYYEVILYRDYRGNCSSLPSNTVANYPVKISFGDSLTYILYTDSLGIAADTLLTPNMPQNGNYPERVEIVDSIDINDDNGQWGRKDRSHPFPANQIVFIRDFFRVYAPYQNLNRCAFSIFPQHVENQPRTIKFNTDFPRVSKNINWQFGDGNTSDEMFPEYTYANSGDYNVCVTIDGCTSCDSVSVSSQNINSCNFSISHTFLKDGIAFFKTDQPAIDRNIVWTFSNSSRNSTSFRPIRSYGTDTIIYCATLNGCNTVCDTLIPPLNCLAYFSSLQKYDKEVELNIPHYRPGPEYILQSTHQGSGITVLDTITGKISNKKFLTTLPQYGDYNMQLIVIDSAANCGDTICYSFALEKPDCLASFYVDTNASGSGNLVVVNSSAFTDSTQVNYSWSFGDGDSSNLAFPTHSYAQFGAYKLCLGVASYSNGQRCNDYYCDTIGIDSLGNFYKNQNGGFTINVISPASVGQAEYQHEVSIFPNPAEDEIFVEGNNDLDGLRVFDLNGKLVLEDDLSSERIDISMLKPGFYMLHFEQKGAGVKNMKLIVQ